ncbi:hypothetical protein PAMP_016598 [Pampus punctatissimus]
MYECVFPEVCNCVRVLSFQEMSCCLSKRFSVKAIHRLLPAPPPLLYPASLVPTPPTPQPPMPGARLPLISTEQMSLNCPPPPLKKLPHHHSSITLTGSRAGVPSRRHPTCEERGVADISTGRRGAGGGDGGVRQAGTHSVGAL